MKILLCNKFYYPRGGDCIHTIALKQLLEEHGHQVAVFAMQYPDNIDNPYTEYWPSEINFGSKNPLKVISAIVRPFGVAEVKMNWSRLLSDFKPDVVHLHNIHSQLSPVIAELAKEQNIPVVWTLHDHKLVCPAYLFMDNDGNSCDQCLKSPLSVIKKKCIKGSSLASVLGYLEARKWNSKLLQQVTDTFICPSLFLRNNMIRGGFSNDKLSHLYNFVDNDKFKSKALNTRVNEVVYVGRISREKGVHSLCEAFKTIGSATLSIIGDGPIKGELENKYACNNINFLGYQNWDFIKNKLSSACCLVLPSECYENNPLTIIESFALGTPVLGANIGGIPELINTTNGMLFEAGKVSDLSEKINLMIECSSWDYQKISDQAKEKFSEEHYYQELMKVYTKSL